MEINRIHFSMPSFLYAREGIKTSVYVTVMKSPTLLSFPSAGRVLDVIQCLALDVMVEEAATCDITHSGALSHRADPALPPGPTALPATQCCLCTFPFEKKSLNFSSLSCLKAILLLETKY